MHDPDTNYHITADGFEWGPATIVRLATVKRRNGTYHVLRVITTDNSAEAIEIYVSPEGRLIRAFKGNSELKTATEWVERV